MAAPGHNNHVQSTDVERNVHESNESMSQWVNESMSQIWKNEIFGKKK